MRIRTLAAFVLAALFISTSVQAGNVTASLEFIPPEVLPGVPATRVFRITNNGTAAARLEPTFRFYLYNQQGVPAPLRPQGIDETGRPYDLPLLSDNDDSAPDTLLAAGKTLEFWFDDIERRERFEPSPFNTGSGVVTVSVEIKADGQVVSTGPVKLKVLQPTGDDLAVWTLMQQRAGSSGWTPDTWDRVADLAPVIFRDYPRSHYTPYFAARMPRVACEIARSCVDPIPFEVALATNPPAPIRENMLLAIAGVHVDRAKYFRSSRNPDRAAEEMSIARPFIDDALRTAIVPRLHEMAKEMAKMPASFADIRDYNSALHGQDPVATERVKPILDCVSISGEVMIARFGYVSPNVSGKEIPLGTGNRFTPTPYDRGQPRWFIPGTHHTAVGVSGDAKKTIAWSLDGQNAVATASSPSCTGSPEDARPIRAFTECAKADGPNVIGRFGYENPNPFPVAIVVGESNQFSANDVKGQPVVFEPGTHRNAITVLAKNASSVTWKLGDSSAVANASKSAPCSSDVK